MARQVDYQKIDGLNDKGKMDDDCYDQLLPALQIELLKLQRWVSRKGRKIIVVFEGRDTAGKGGTIKRFTEHLNPRACKTVALAKPTDVERGQWYFQRYVDHFPTAGEIVVFDRSWYNRAGVEKVMGFCTDEEYEKFMTSVPFFEGMIVRENTTLLKIWLDITKKEQKKRLDARRDDPLKHWKISPLDEVAQEKWDAYTKAKRIMFKRTSTPWAPWTICKCDDKKRSRINVLRFILSQFDYDDRDKKLPLPDPNVIGSPTDARFAD